MTIPSDKLAAILAAATKGPWAHAMPKSGWITAQHPIISMFHVADIRGWGDLTGKGHGALGLSNSAAIAVQTANAALIALAPDIAAEVLRLRAERTVSVAEAARVLSVARQAWLDDVRAELTDEVQNLLRLSGDPLRALAGDPT